MRLAVTLSLAACLGAVDAVPEFLKSKAPDRTTQRDVVVIGGGSSGTYAAVKLRRMGKRVALIERDDHLGGHTSTYHVPGTNVTVDYGVQGYGNKQVIRDYFESFGIPLINVPVSETGFGVSNYVDFRNGRTVRNFDFNRDLSGYAAQVQRYPYLSYSPRLPDPVPRDLLLPLRDFLRKYRLQDSTYNLFYSLQGQGDILSQPALYVLRYLGPEYLEVLDPDSDGALVTARRNNQEVYERAQKWLGRDVFLSSRVVAAHRDSRGVRVVVRTPDGGVRTIRAKKLLVTMPLMERNMEPLGLDSRERRLFSKFEATGWYVGVIKAAGLPENFEYQNTRPDTRWNLPELPALYQMSPTEVPGTYLIRYGSEGDLPDRVVKREMLRAFDRVRFAVIGKRAQRFKPAELLEYASHYPFNLRVSPREIALGFYNKLDDLQGHRNTWYSGATVISHSTGTLWNFTDHLVDRMYGGI
ncbi:hypothetical protein ACJ41O_007807 [Fusarium nematophilum]